ncbi:hypothetical protein FRB98_007991 [Tulasnella sp. 332]|nr:hypothetical protein FRB98_007991 [Tulasnella sp. 332]
MDPLNPESFNLQKIKLPTGRTYEYCDQTPTDYKHDETPVLLLIHGFPELWYDWRYQIGPWDKPDDPALYTPFALAGEMADLLDALDVKKPIVVIAHDWGAPTAFSFATRYTERTKALVS